MAPASLASSSFLSAGAFQFEKRTGPAPEITGLRSLVDDLNVVSRPHEEVIEDLKNSKRYFTDLLHSRKQTTLADRELSNTLITPILRSENARNPGLNAIGCSDEKRMADILRIISRSNPGEEGHVRFHVGVWNDNHRMAVDAFQHREGGFTLIYMDPMLNLIFSYELSRLQKQHSDVIKGTMDIRTHNQVHTEGCRIFSVHFLNAMHDYQPHFLNLHRDIYAAKEVKPEPRLADPRWESWGGTHVLDNELDNFGFFPAKFFKHWQVRKPDKGERNKLDQAEEWNPALRHQPVNKKGTYSAPDRRGAS
jgi:hypothetical protein